MITKESYYVGTNTNALHVEEALRQGILRTDERLLGIFDGIFYDSDSNRVGGLALNDFLVITDRRLTTWARDQLKDYVDSFPLSHVFVKSQRDKDSLHATLHLELVLPDVEDAAVAQAEKFGLTFDFMPIADVKLAYDLIEVMSNLNRDMLAGGAGEADRIKAASVMFEKVFVGRAQTKAARAASPAKRPVSNSNPEPLYEIVEGEALDDMMTPLRRLDSLDDFNKVKKIAPKVQAETFSSISQPLSPTENKSEYESESRLWSELDEQPSPVNPYTQGRTTRVRHSRQPETDGATSDFIPEKLGGPSKPPGVRLREDVAAGGPEGLYTLGRAGRAAWDGMERLRREAESKSTNVLPMIQNLRESGMNLHDMTEFVTALNNLLETLGSSPAAFELARSFINRNAGINLHGHTAPKAKKGPVRVEEAGTESATGDDIPTATDSKPDDVEKFNLGGLFGNGSKRKPISLRSSKTEDVIPPLDSADIAPVRRRVMVRNQEISDDVDAVAASGGVTNDEIMLLFSKVEVPPLDGFDGITAPEVDDNESSKLFDSTLPDELNFENEVVANKLTTSGRRSLIVRSAPVGPELN